MSLIRMLECDEAACSEPQIATDSMWENWR
jgi:hypothetical protein